MVQPTPEHSLGRKKLLFLLLSIVFITTVSVMYYFESNLPVNAPTNVSVTNSRLTVAVSTSTNSALKDTHAETYDTSTSIRSSSQSTTSIKSTTGIEYSTPHFMTISGNGRLGNKMFQFAALLGTSYRLHYTPFISQHHALHAVFDIPREYIRPLRKLSNVKAIGEGAAGIYFKKLETLPTDKNYTLAGYYQSWKYFDFISDVVRKAFKFKANFLKKAEIALSTYAEGKRPLVGVHVRRSDMNSRRELSRGYNVASKQFFLKAFDFFRTNITDPIFVVVSDDLGWCKANLKAQDVRFVTTGHPGGDLAIVAHCNHSVISSGTYGWWGGYLSGGTVVYFSNYPAKNTWLATQYKAADYYPPYWIGME